MTARQRTGARPRGDERTLTDPQPHDSIRRSPGRIVVKTDAGPPPECRGRNGGADSGRGTRQACGISAKEHRT
jgi:hypothetical protein